jgi:hypothetical protein
LTREDDIADILPVLTPAQEMVLFDLLEAGKAGASLVGAEWRTACGLTRAGLVETPDHTTSRLTELGRLVAERLP